MAKKLNNSNPAASSDLRSLAENRLEQKHLSTQHSALRTQHFASTQYYLSPDKLKAEGWNYYSIGRV